jgi:hypothetical protein
MGRERGNGGGFPRPEKPVVSRLQVVAALQFAGWCRGVRLAVAFVTVVFVSFAESEKERERERERERKAAWSNPT